MLLITSASARPGMRLMDFAETTDSPGLRLGRRRNCTTTFLSSVTLEFVLPEARSFSTSTSEESDEDFTGSFDSACAEFIPDSVPEPTSSTVTSLGPSVLLKVLSLPKYRSS